MMLRRHFEAEREKNITTSKDVMPKKTEAVSEKPKKGRPKKAEG